MTVPPERYPRMSDRPQFSEFIATDDDPERGIKAGDVFMWDYGPNGARLMQTRKWKNAASILELADLGLIQPLPALPSPARNVVGIPPHGGGVPPLRLVE